MPDSKPLTSSVTHIEKEGHEAFAPPLEEDSKEEYSKADTSREVPSPVDES